MYNLFLDDFRNLEETFLYTKQLMYLQDGWVIVRNYQQFVDKIIELGLPNIISYDHDLADEHYDWYSELDTSEKIDYSVYKEKTGYHCALWLIEYCKKNKLEFPEYYIHSMNVKGKYNIITEIEKYRKENG